MTASKNTEQKYYSKKSWITFLVMVIAVSALTEGFINAGGPVWLYIILMWTPAVSAVTARYLYLKEKRHTVSAKDIRSSLGIRSSKWKYILPGVLIPLVYLLVPYMIYWKLYPENFAYTGVSLGVILKDLLPPLLVGIFPSLLTALGEEIGWRGYMLPVLTEKEGMKKAVLITSVFWCCWHLPLLIFGDYMSGAPVWFKIPAFILCIFPVGIIAAVLTYKSGSVWPAAFLHAAHNNYDQAVFGVITRGDNRMFYVSETGVLTILCAWSIAAVMIMYMRRESTAGIN